MSVSLYSDTLGAGAVVGSFEVLERAAAGSFAAVYRGRHLTTGRVAALKVMHRALCHDARLIERFHREVAAIERVRHERVASIVEHGELDDGRPYLAMEWLDGRTLAAELLARGPLAAGEARAVLAEIADALGAVHAAGIVHRDLKAENIMAVPRRGWFETRLIDFGIARLVARDGDSAAPFHTHSIVGTPGTMAPEQITGATVDPRTDVYAMGGLLFQLVTGRLPFADAGADPAALEVMHLHAPPPDAAALAPVSAAFSAVIQRALAKRLEDRYPSAAAMLEALDHALAEDAGPGAAGALAALHRKPGARVYIEIQAADDSADDSPERADSRADALADALAQAHERVAAAGLSVSAATSDALWATAPLPGDSTAARARRRVMLDAMLALERAAAPHPVCVRALLTIGERAADLPVAWPARAGVFAAPEMLDGLDEYSAPERAPGRRALTRVTARRRADR